MAIEFDASSNGGTFGTSHSFTHTVTAGGSDRILIVVVGTYLQTGPSGVTYGGNAMTKHVDKWGENAGATGIYVNVTIWYLVAPPTGANTVSITGIGSDTNICCVASSYTGVDQSNPVGAAVEGSSGAGSSLSVNVSSQSDYLVVDGIAVRYEDNINHLVQGAGQTLRQRRLQGAGGTAVACGTSEEVGAATTTMGWTFSQSNTNYPEAMGAFSLLAASPGRSRLIKHIANTFDPKRRIFDNQGRSVRPGLLKAGEWFRNEGPYLLKANKPASLIQMPPVGFIEAVKEADDRDADLQTDPETMLENLFRRLGGRAA